MCVCVSSCKVYCDTVGVRCVRRPPLGDFVFVIARHCCRCFTGLGCVRSRCVLRHWLYVSVGAVEGCKPTCDVCLCSGQGVGNIICVRVCSLKEHMCVRLGCKCTSRGTVAEALSHEGTGLCLRPSVTPAAFRVLCGHGLCVPAAERAGAGAASEPVPGPQWALVFGRYVCAHMNGCMCACTYVRGLVLGVPSGSWKRRHEQSSLPNKCVDEGPCCFVLREPPNTQTHTEGCAPPPNHLHPARS